MIRIQPMNPRNVAPRYRVGVFVVGGVVGGWKVAADRGVPRVE
ncbi:hypothetical protein [Engelhardtia mirabilis]|uniref:Uncharacterized protein n=1 Tax=Engelhardtia mirabilis TaxID=2528011 RepID=A0A518BIL4_9BACT|nr:hypothetical protein Pla133_18940 [Planctomycetes bacterium Pla133]QDV01144.1 hypothetical protein Pla86_18930 [Planctomycetes bacterium Pla86]